MTVRRSPVRIPIRIPIHRPLPGPAGGAERARGQHRGPRPSTTRRAVLTVALPSAATLGVFGVAAATVHADRTRPPGPAPSGPSFPSRSPAGERPGPDRADRELARAALAARSRPRPQQPPQPGGPEDQDTAPRPPYVLPVERAGLSAGFGQAGPHWAARHTGIDFPVPAGTPVRAATDGTVTTGWSAAYGYLAVVTAADGTETWYGHLRGYRLPGGPIRAGEVIGWAGSTGNATGPHLHFEVRPGGRAPVDPVPWLLAHGVDPR
ncbi:M23 family metallopeptidase [Streptomyces sp. NRRL B-24484]|uniref:M23 family metallopeptidase n=1 Tax=Streptomyces sp. NRRL B-24484 TaxID=1463833 RepID=UPI000694AB66|nr:M23 family metallopeptidase [Streptomyces sp. NRRL B-24484]